MLGKSQAVENTEKISKGMVLYFLWLTVFEMP